MDSLYYFISVIFLLGADSPSETHSQHIEMLQFRSQITPNMEPISASLQGADQFEVAWRLQESSPQNLFIATTALPIINPTISGNLSFQAGNGCLLSKQPSSPNPR